MERRACASGLSHKARVPNAAGRCGDHALYHRHWFQHEKIVLAGKPAGSAVQTFSAGGVALGQRDYPDMARDLLAADGEQSGRRPGGGAGGGDCVEAVVGQGRKLARVEGRHYGPGRPVEVLGDGEGPAVCGEAGSYRPDLAARDRCNALQEGSLGPRAGTRTRDQALPSQCNK